MFNTFIKKIKTNLFDVKNKFTFFLRLVNVKLIFTVVYTLVVYDFLVSINSYSFFFCSFLNFFFSWINPANLIVFLSFYFIISLRVFLYMFIRTLFKSSNTKISLFQYNSSSNSLYLQLLYIVYNKSSFLINLNYLINWYLFFLDYVLNRFFFINFISSKIKNSITLIYWYPLFKRHSVFGYYRITRQRWTELKSEEINYLKY